MDAILVIMLGGLAFGAYLTPYIVAAIRNHPFTYWVFWVNLLLGWTIVGWLAAFIWAVVEKPVPTTSS